MRYIIQTNNQFTTRSFSNYRKRDKKDKKVIILRNNYNNSQTKRNRGVLESSNIVN